MVRKIGVGLIGCGSISGAHAAAYKQWRDMADVIATCDVDRAKARARADALRTGKDVPVTGEDGYLALEACMAAYESAEKGVVVKL